MEEREAWGQGGPVSFAELYDELETTLHRYAATLVRDQEHAADLVQETFIRAWGHLSLLGQLTAPQRRTWLRRVLRNLFIDQRRRAAREQLLMAQLERFTPRNVTDSLVSLQVEGLLDTLPEPLRDLWYQRYEVGMSGVELARAMGISPATVRSRLHAARKLLRRQVDRYL